MDWVVCIALVIRPGDFCGNIGGVSQRRTRREVLRPRNLACGGREGTSVAWACEGCLGGISETTRRAFEGVQVPGQQARVVVALGRLLGGFIDDLCRHALERTRFGLGGVSLDAWLGLAVDEGGDGCEFGVVGVVDGLDAVLVRELVWGERGAGGRDAS
jgi:hypothetical protein